MIPRLVPTSGYTGANEVATISCVLEHIIGQHVVPGELPPKVAVWRRADLNM
ncbi:MAG: hypothetical protein IPM29_18215 [Planctomycetes bacterium]|nr:hypothetical protein [Planctomycetota bacterium]